MKIICFAAFVCFLIHSPHAAWAAERCDPVEHLISERSELLKDKTTAFAFLQTMNREQWQRAKESGSLYAIGYGGASYEADKAKASRDAESVGYNYSGKQSYHWLSNRVSATGLRAYIACLENESAGLSAWVDGMEGDYVSVRVKFRPANSDFRVRPTILDNFERISALPETFEPQRPRTINFRRLSGRQGLIEIYVGTEMASLLFPPVKQLVAPSPTFKPSTLETKGFVSEEVAEATQPYRVRHAQPHVVEKCTHPPAGWTFKANSARLVIESTVASNSAEITSQEPTRICWRATGYTGDRMIFANIKAKVAADIQRRE